MTVTSKFSTPDIQRQPHPNTSAADKRMQRILRSLLNSQPFFALLALRMPMQADSKHETIASDGQTIYYSPNWVLENTGDSVRTALSRVVLACALKHHTR